MANKQKPNAYSAFVKHVARQRQGRGEQVNFAALFKELDSEWRSMSDEEKQRFKDRASYQREYEDRAQVESLNNQTANDTLPLRNGDQRMICDAAGTELVAKRPHEDDSMSSSGPLVKKLRPGIPNWHKIKHLNLVQPEFYSDMHLLNIRNICQTIIRNRERTLVDMPIYSFSVNVLCKQTIEKEDIFIPLEISIFAYSLKRGKLGEPYHVIIDSGDVPSNCLTKALDHAVNHKIQFPPRGRYPSCARNDYRKIYKEMQDYTRDGEKTILISDAKDLPQVTKSLEWLHKKACEIGGMLPRVSTWTILPVTEYVTSMYNFVNESMLHIRLPTIPLQYWIKVQLDQCSLDYNSSLMCDYHKEEENQTKWCAQSCAMRLINNIEDPVLDDIFKLYQMAVDPLRRKPPIMGPNPAQIPPQILADVHMTTQPQLMSDNEPQSIQIGDTQPPLAIEAPPGISISSKDPRLNGKIQPSTSVISMNVVSEGSFVAVDPEPIPESVPQPPPKPKEKLIIASGDTIDENPPDIY